MKISEYIYLPTKTRTPYLLNYLIGSLMAVLYISSLLSIQPFVPLFYTLSTSAQQLVPTAYLVIFPIMSFTITTAHLLLSQIWKFLDSMILQLFAWMTFLIQFLLLLTMVRIIWLVS